MKSKKKVVTRKERIAQKLNSGLEQHTDRYIQAFVAQTEKGEEALNLQQFAAAERIFTNALMTYHKAPQNSSDTAQIMVKFNTIRLLYNRSKSYIMMAKPSRDPKNFERSFNDCMYVVDHAKNFEIHENFSTCKNYHDDCYSYMEQSYECRFGSGAKMFNYAYYGVGTSPPGSREIQEKWALALGIDLSVPPLERSEAEFERYATEGSTHLANKQFALGVESLKTALLCRPEPVVGRFRLISLNVYLAQALCYKALAEPTKDRTLITRALNSTRSKTDSGDGYPLLSDFNAEEKVVVDAIKALDAQMQILFDEWFIHEQEVARRGIPAMERYHDAVMKADEAGERIPTREEFEILEALQKVSL
jgi:hypothetical protein